MRRLSDDIIFQMLKATNHTDVWKPRTDVYETANQLVIKVAIPGLDPSDIELTLSEDGRNMNIKGVRTEIDDPSCCRIKYHQLEIYYGNFEKDIEIPSDIYIDKENISAKYKDGILLITLAKKEYSGVKTISIDS